MTNSPDNPSYAMLQVRSSLGSGSQKQMDCRVGALNGKRLSLVARQRVPVSTPVSVEYNDSLLLGEVVACTQSCDDQWHIELKLEQVLTGLQSLMVLRQRLLSESEPSRANAVNAAVATRA